MTGMSNPPCETSGNRDTNLGKQNDFNLPKTRGFKIAPSTLQAYRSI
jgi:hypothetical protein